MSITKESSILVTGGTGVLGAYIVKSLLEHGYRSIEVLSRKGRPEHFDFEGVDSVKFTAADITEIYPLEDVIKRSDVVIHAAAIVSFDPAVFKQMFKVNVEGTKNVVNLCNDHQVKKLIHISSIAAIGRSANQGVVDEDTTWKNGKYNTYYGVTKYLAEQEVWRSYHEGLPSVIVNPSLIIGDGDWGQSSLRIFQRAYEGIPFYPSGSTGIVDVRDVASIVVKVLESDIKRTSND